MAQPLEATREHDAADNRTSRRLAGHRPRIRAVAAGLAMIAVALLAWKTVHLVVVAQQARHDTEAVVAALKLQQEQPDDRSALTSVTTTLAPTARSLRALQTELRPLSPLLSLTRPLPTEVRWLADLPDVLAVAVPLADVGAAASQWLVAGPSDRQGRSSDGRSSERISSVIRQIASELDAASPAVARLREHPLSGPLQPLQPTLSWLAPQFADIRELLGVLGVVAPLLGTPEPRTYLLLGQNTDELRATGGFIGTAGAVTFGNGGLVDFNYGSSYELDVGATAPPPPPPLKRHLGLEGLYLRDANWWPDFPATAAEVRQAWQRAAGKPIAGVIAVDNAVIHSALRILGPVEVQGFGPVGTENFERLAAEHLYSPTAAATAGGFHRNTTAFFDPFGKAVVARLRRLSPDELFALARELVRLLDEKHVQLASSDSSLAEHLYQHGWTGAVPPVDGDSLYVVDTTVSYGKTHMFVQSDSTLQIRPGDDERAHHDLELRYSNVYPRGLQSWMPAEMISGDYFDAEANRLVKAPGFWGDWLRVYLPADADDVQISGLAEVSPPRDEFGRTVIEGYLPLRPREERLVRVQYATPGVSQRASLPYRLFLQKQAGLHCRPVVIQLQWPDQKTSEYRGCPTVDGWIHLAE